jgi:glycosyltransferase involved in cell wall biosynthesis
MQPQAAPHRTESLLHTAPHALWRGLPPTLRRRALAHATGWLAPKPLYRVGATVPGIAIAGEFSRASGLGETARLMAAAARRMGLAVWTIDLPPPIDARSEVTRPDIAMAAHSAPPPGVPLVLHVNAPMLPLALLRLPAAIVRNRPIVGYWAWEMPQAPLDWRPALACVSQVWVPSHFTAAALEPLLPGRVRVVPPPLAMAPPVASTLDRAAFGLPPDAVVVLVSFNLASSFARKNPFAAIAAFREAFGDRPDRILVLKVSHPDHAPADFERLVQMTQAPNIRLETGTLPPDDSHALTACADIVLSLHRGEGFGLVLAEAMLMGKPVIATAWSGNMDFMGHTNAALVGYRLVPARDDRSVYRGQWAEPDVAEAAQRLRMLADDPTERKRLGEQASSSTLAKLDGHELAAALGGLT